MTFKIDLKIILFLAFFYFTRQIEIYIIILMSITMHEGCHLIFGLMLKKKVRTIMLLPIGFSIEFQTNYSKEAKVKKSNIRLQELKNLIIEVAGPISNILIIIFLVIFNINQENIIYANFFIAIFNLLPIYPLDGGRILNSVFILVTNKKYHLKKIMQISYITIFFISAITIVFSYYFKNFKIIFTLLYLWYIFIKEQKNYKQKMKIQKILKHLQKNCIKNNFMI